MTLFRPASAPIWFPAFSRSVERLAQRKAMPAYTVATVPPAAEHRYEWIVVTDEAGGATPAWSDGTDWLRMTDNAVIS